LVPWTFHWFLGHFIGSLDVSLVPWTLHWFIGHFIGSFDTSLVPWTFHWFLGHFIGSLDVSLVPWTLHWFLGHFIGSLDVSLVPWTLHWFIGHFKLLWLPVALSLSQSALTSSLSLSLLWLPVALSLSLKPSLSTMKSAIEIVCIIIIHLFLVLRTNRFISANRQFNIDVAVQFSLILNPKPPHWKLVQVVMSSRLSESRLKLLVQTGPARHILLLLVTSNKCFEDVELEPRQREKGRAPSPRYRSDPRRFWKVGSRSVDPGSQNTRGFCLLPADKSSVCAALKCLLFVHY